MSRASAMLCASAALADTASANTTYALAVPRSLATLPVRMAARRGIFASSLTGTDRSRTDSTAPYLTAIEH